MGLAFRTTPIWSTPTRTPAITCTGCTKRAGLRGGAGRGGVGRAPGRWIAAISPFARWAHHLADSCQSSASLPGVGADPSGRNSTASCDPVSRQRPAGGGGREGALSSRDRRTRQSGGRTRSAEDLLISNRPLPTPSRADAQGRSRIPPKTPPVSGQGVKQHRLLRSGSSPDVSARRGRSGGGRLEPRDRRTRQSGGRTRSAGGSLTVTAPPYLPARGRAGEEPDPPKTPAVSG